MDWEGIVFAAVTSAMVTGAIVWMLAFWAGMSMERTAWTMRALKEDGCGTPHHCDGEFYYIVPEHTFCDEFMRRPPEFRRTKQEGDQ